MSFLRCVFCYYDFPCEKMSRYNRIYHLFFALISLNMLHLPIFPVNSSKFPSMNALDSYNYIMSESGQDMRICLNKWAFRPSHYRPSGTPGGEGHVRRIPLRTDRDLRPLNTSEKWFKLKGSSGGKDILFIRHKK